MEDAPVDAFAVPLADVCTTFSTHVVSAAKGAGLTIGSGGPKKQFASGPHEPAAPPPFPSVAHEGSELLLMQCFPGPSPTVQVFSLPVFAPVSTAPLMERMDVEPSGMAPGGTTVALPPPK